MLSRPQDYSAATKIKSMKNSNDTVGNQTQKLGYHPYILRREVCISKKSGRIYQYDVRVASVVRLLHQFQDIVMMNAADTSDTFVTIYQSI
jgi:hypothetical protein